MLSRALRTVAPRVVHTARVLHPFTTTAMQSTKFEQVAKTEVHLSDYTSDGDKGEHTVIDVDQSKPVTGPVMDVAKKAYALEPGLVKKLSPTLAKFTLEGKVALITGYVRVYSCLL